MSKLASDARIDPRIRASAQDLPDSSVLTGNFETREKYISHVMQTFSQQAGHAPVQPAQPVRAEVKALWSKANLQITTEHFVSHPDGNQCALLLIRPVRGCSKPVSLVYYIHGGGMAVGSAFAPDKIAWGRMIANQGVAVALVDFRNSLLPSALFGRGGSNEVAQFPGGLNDCYSGLQFVHSNAERFGLNPLRILVAGESGGGNLTIAVALKAAREGQSRLLGAGFYALCPYIAGQWPQNETNTGVLGTSHLEAMNMGLGLNLGGNAPALAYSATTECTDNLAWPAHTTVEELKVLQGVEGTISVNECDPLRDEGVLFYRKCIQAGLRIRCRGVLGTPHGGDLMLSAVPDIALETARSIVDRAWGRTSVPTPLNNTRSKL